jgi:hypothetical protein
MKYLLEKKVAINPEPEFKSLYRWCLNEFDTGSNKSKHNLIPWSWSLYFTASSIRVVRESSIEVSSVEENSFESNSKNETRIYATLHPGHVGHKEYLDAEVEYSFIGTDRVIKEFVLCISPAINGKKELCSVVAIPSYEAEIDFGNEVETDYLGLEVCIDRDYFDALVRLIDSKSVDTAWIRLGHVTGFYSDWSPSVSTRFIKVLTNEIKIEGVEEAKIKPPVAQMAHQFNLYVGSINKLAPEAYSLKHSGDTFIKILSDLPATDLDEDTQQKHDSVSLFEKYFQSAASLVENLASKVRTLLWLIFIALFILIIK